jgi:hypothetical protein
MLGAEPGYRSELVRLGAPGLVSEAEASRRETLVRRSPLFAGLTASECREIVSAAHEKHFARRQTIFVKGDLVQQVILLTSGAAKTVQFTASRAEVILGLRGPGELVGTVGLRPQDRHHLMAQALVSSSALVWDAAAFEAFSQRSMHHAHTLPATSGTGRALPRDSDGKGCCEAKPSVCSLDPAGWPSSGRGYRN